MRWLLTATFCVGIVWAFSRGKEEILKKDYHWEQEGEEWYLHKEGYRGCFAIVRWYAKDQKWHHECMDYSSEGYESREEAMRAAEVEVGLTSHRGK